MQSSPVPSGRLSRLLHYGSLAGGMAVGGISESLRRIGNSEEARSKPASVFLSPANLERLVKKFSQMRGAALKIGQQLSIQDSKILPAEIQEVLIRVQNNANFMPRGQLEKVMTKELGANWRDLFVQFDDIPIAAASIGQVHKGILKNGNIPVAVKVQYPGVKDSIDSDLNNMMMLLNASRLLPEGLYLDKTIANSRVELKWECDYIREANNMEKFATLFKDSPTFVVPKVFREACTEKVLTQEFMTGTEIIKGNWDQETNNWIAGNIMKLCLTEIAKFKFMQTDPNWANFLYNNETGKIELLDFGASRSFSDEFVKNYLNALRAGVRNDRINCERFSRTLGYLTGLEAQTMVDAHVDSLIVLGEPYNASNNYHSYDFSHQTVTDRVRTNIGVMLRERLTPPPEETYSLHRKLSGAYLLCARLDAVVPTQKWFEEIVGLEYE
ncbi:ABC1-domain-containing protein [Nadsonia fulvescens var. elongata DSM 6958]|uniref:ABC1-domain-containing protein n=1 Tax=Nadsonia fulvescens var. elongata DSM 6958 TaxID=857566 RepID=A0A1E3PKI6_9ASCO|nr:ABC1-domain-containing protein [Nadsonia fulvescens var. elongata DSM 6958]